MEVVHGSGDDNSVDQNRGMHAIVGFRTYLTCVTLKSNTVHGKRHEKLERRTVENPDD
jgi:hypothetical protein